MPIGNVGPQGPIAAPKPLGAAAAPPVGTTCAVPGPSGDVIHTTTTPGDPFACGGPKPNLDDLAIPETLPVTRFGQSDGGGYNSVRQGKA